MGPNLEAAAEAIRRAGWADRCWLVGGAVRDDLLGRGGTGDVDVVVLGDALAVARELYQKGLAEGPPVSYERFGTAMVRLGEMAIEFATSREESYTLGSRKPEVQPASIEADARRRDFTVNTLLRSAQTGELLDPLGTGLADLEAKVLRTPGPPDASFRDDPLRQYRAVRFRWKLGFSYADGLEDAIRESAHLAAGLSAERVRDELSLVLMLDSAGFALDEAESFGLLARVSPEFAKMRNVGQGTYHHLDAWRHTCAVVQASPPDLVSRLAAWLHDIGKPATAAERDGKTTFYGHEKVGAEMAAAILRRLRYPASVCARVERLVLGHMRFSSPTPPGTAGLRRVVRDFGDDAGRLLDLVEADRSALRPGVDVGDLGAVRERLRAVREETPREVLVSPLSGEEVMAVLGVGPGPEVGRWKNALAEAVIQGEVLPGDKESARVWLLGARNRPYDSPVEEV